MPWTRVFSPAPQATPVTIECLVGDIANQPGMDAIVNAANAELRSGGGVAGAIHRAAGPELERECRPLAPIAPGQAVITGAQGLPNRHVIHCLGPVYGRDEPADVLLASCYRESLRLATAAGARSLAFPAISTGAFGYPLALAAGVAARTIVTSVPPTSSLRLIRFVLASSEDARVHEEAFENALARSNPRWSEAKPR